jgi:hypothetical protein
VSSFYAQRTVPPRPGNVFVVFGSGSTCPCSQDAFEVLVANPPKMAPEPASLTLLGVGIWVSRHRGVRLQVSV